MIRANHEGILYDRVSILGEAPHESGVYGIYNRHTWIYVGETGDIQARLLEHLSGENEWMARYDPTGFQNERCHASQRVWRQNAWIGALNPACNKHLEKGVILQANS